MADAARGSGIKFGTDGWRGYIAGDFTFDNVALVISALRAYLQEQQLAERPLLVGCDRRFGAELLAAHAATHLASLGQRVLLVEPATPTPAIAFAVKHLEAAGAIQLTASHNPYFWQGLKFIPDFAGPAMPETTDRITELIRELGPRFTPPPVALAFSGETVSVQAEYFAQLDRLVDLKGGRPSLVAKGAHGGAPSLKVLYTAMHGCGAGWLDGYLKRAGVEVDAVATERDVYFGGTLPDPSPANLAPLARRARDGGYSVAVGTDGDADRFGIVDPPGNYYSANQALPLLADYLIRARGLRGQLARTIATSHRLDAVAQEHGLPLVETVVGFKYIGDELRRGALIGGEESGGISIAGHVPEKDGILASLLLLEIMAQSGKDLAALSEDLSQRIGRSAYRRVDLVMPEDAKQRLFTALRELEPGGNFAGQGVSEVMALDGVKIIFRNDSEPDGCWAMIRASGTEPVIRIYLEAPGQAELTAMTEAVQSEVARLSGQSVQLAAGN